ncbi:MAG: DUF6152 family protein [Acidobacteriota bacterium]
MRRAFGMAVLAGVMVSGIPATAHHSNPLYFDVAKAVTLQGDVLRVMWINPHIVLFLQSKDEKGEPETWILQGASLNNAMRQVGLKERLQPGISISARVWPPRNPLFLNDTQTVLLTRPDDARQSAHIVGGGQIRFSNGDVLAFGGGPTF